MFPFSALCALFLVFLEKAMVPWPLVGRGCWVSGRRGAVGFPTELTEAWQGKPAKRTPQFLKGVGQGGAEARGGEKMGEARRSQDAAGFCGSTATVYRSDGAVWPRIVKRSWCHPRTVQSSVGIVNIVILWWRCHYNVIPGLVDQRNVILRHCGLDNVILVRVSRCNVIPVTAINSCW